MITNDSSLPAVNRSVDKVENKAKVESKAEVDNKTHAKTTMIKGEQYVMSIHRCDVKVKVKENNQVKVESLFPGAKANLTDLRTVTERLQLGKHQIAKHLFNSEVNLVSDWLVEHHPKKLSNKRYKRLKKGTLTFVFQEDPQFELAGRTVQVKDDVSTIESGVKIQPLHGAEFINLSDYNIIEITNPTYFGMAMGMSNIQNVSMLFSMVSKRRCQQINKKMWEKAQVTLNQAEKASYINFRGKKCLGTNRTYVCYGHRKDPLGMKLGQHSLLLNTPDDVKKSVNDGIGDIISFLELASRSVFYSLQSSITFLDVKDKYRITDVYARKDLDKETSTLGFATQLCVGVDYWSSIHIDNNFYYTTLSCLTDNMDDNAILFYFVFPSYRVAVQMRCGDVACFNPLIYHCCTDPTTHGVKNFSCYVSAKTCNTQIAKTHGNG
jgi:hypothetical protein